MTRLPAALARTPVSTQQTLGRVLLGGALACAGISHLTAARREFQAQVPAWVPLDADTVVVASGIVEIALGSALVALPGERTALGWTAAAFFVGVFPGNVSQLATHSDAFGLDSDRARAARLAFQPLLVLWALWSTGALRSLRASR